MYKTTRSYQRPENALKRANEFIDVSKPTRALEVLYEVIKRGKMRANYSEKLLEPIMFKYLELCVDLKKSHLAKEGLYQYRNIFQSVNVSSLETVVRFYLRLAEERTEAARKESHQAVVDIDDLDNLATPEEILLSAVSGEDAQDRSDRTILTPWVKFLWESYRQCLELLRTNSRVEKLYHNIAQHAFKFCEKYSRKTEFRKLCDNLRTHLTHIQKQQGSATAVNLSNPETQQMNLETRLEQLNYSIKMELWQEAYKAIEDISDLMKKSKKMPKPSVMASYYQKLALVFWKAGNHLFHAASLLKLFQLLRDQKKNVTSEEISKRASIVLVATLAIPLPSAHPEFDRFIETEKSALEKIDKLAMLLSLPKPPTRVSLIKDLVRFNVVSSVPTELQNMYQLLEVEFDPLHLCTRMQLFLNWITEKPESGLPQYTLALQEMTITRLVKQAGQVYQTITLKRLLELSVFITAFHLERILVDLVRHNDLQIRIDHRSRCVHFGLDLSESQREDLPEGPTLQSLPSENIRCQLVEMSSVLQKCLALIGPENKKRDMEPLRAQTILLYQQTKQRDHQMILQRQHIIEERKEMLENQNLEREELQRKALEEQLKRQKEEEEERLRREASKREKERHEEELKQIHTKQIKDKLLLISKTSYGAKMIEKLDKDALLNLGADEILHRQVVELEKERKELQKKLKLQEKTVDYFERARRLLEIPRLKRSLEQQKERDKEFWKFQEEDRVTKLVEEHKVALENSKRLRRMLLDKEPFVDKLRSSRRSDIQKKLNDFATRLEMERKNRLAERKDQRRKERRDAYYRKKEEEEQQRRDEELKKQREDEERIETEKMQREEEQRTMRQKGEIEKEVEQNHTDNVDNDELKSGPWRPNKQAAWRQKEQKKMDVWRVKEENGEQESYGDRFPSMDIRRNEGESKKDEPVNWRSKDERGSPARDMDGPPRGKGSSRGMNDYDTGSYRDRDRDLKRGSFRDYDRGPPSRDIERGPPSRDIERGPPPSRDIERGPPSRDIERGPPSRDIERGPPSRDIERGPPSRDIERGPPSRDIERGPPPTRDIERGPPPTRDIERGSTPTRDIERGPPPTRDIERGPPPTRDIERGPLPREFERGPPPREFERGPPPREFERGPPPRDFERRPPPRDIDRERGPPLRGREDRGYFRGQREPDEPSKGDEQSWRRTPEIKRDDKWRDESRPIFRRDERRPPEGRKSFENPSWRGNNENSREDHEEGTGGHPSPKRENMKPLGKREEPKSAKDEPKKEPRRLKEVDEDGFTVVHR